MRGRRRQVGHWGIAATLAIAGGLVAALAGPSRACAADLESAATGEGAVRPRIGLVLGGGGAKGAAHIGVLQVLEELHVPVDCVIGTSMGALVGGIYASGVGATELEAAVRQIPWNEVIGFSSRREKEPMRRKLSGVTYSNSLAFGLKDGDFVTPRGFIGTQNVEQTIRLLAARGRSVEDFDDLAIPFRAIATDMRTGDMVVLERGDLATAMRASMAVPGVFAPVQIEDRLLGDGGLVRNLAVDVARELCADVVIAVALPNPPPTDAEVASPVGLIERTLDVLIGANEREQLRALGPQDVPIIVHNTELKQGSFDRVQEAIPVGHAAAMGASAALARLALPEAEYLAWRERTRREVQGSMRLASVEVRGLERTNPGYVAANLPLQPGDEVDLVGVAHAVDTLYATGEFSALDYRLAGEPSASQLEIRATERELGTTSLRFDVGLYADSDQNTAFILGGDLRRSWVNELGGEWHAAFQLGRTTALQTSFYQPLDPAQRWFLEPSIRVEQSIEDIYFDGDATARYEFEAALLELDVGRVFGNRGELRAGVVFGSQSAERSIAPPDFPEEKGVGYGGWTLRYVYDSRDHAILSTRGWLARLQYVASEEGLGAELNYDRLEAMVQHTLPLYDNVVYLRASGGTSFDTELPAYDTFVLGGPTSFPGLAIGELRGYEYWAFNASYLHKVADISALFGQAFYLGGGLAVGDMNDPLRMDPILSASLLASARTPLGPLQLSLATTSEGGWQIGFTLGRPIEERAITDPVW